MTKIKINSNGSIRVEGEFEIIDANGNPYDLAGRTVVTLCRCGLSQNKPFCDSSHRGEFMDESVAFALPPQKPKPE